MYSFILFDSHIQFYCNNKDCANNEQNVCKIKILFISSALLDEYYRMKINKFCRKNFVKAGTKINIKKR